MNPLYERAPASLAAGQAVDVVQPILARLLGLSELKLEVAGGPGSAVSLAFLKEEEADALRAELLARAATAEVLGVAPTQVRASFTDDAGLLALQLALPLPVPALTRVAEDPSVEAENRVTCHHDGPVGEVLVKASRLND